MKKYFEEYIDKLEEYKKVHHFQYKEIASMLDTTPRSLRRWIRKEYCPLPIYQAKIKELLKRGLKYE